MRSLLVLLVLGLLVLGLLILGLLPSIIGPLVLRRLLLRLLRRLLPGLLRLRLIQPDLLGGRILVEIWIPGAEVLPASIRLLRITHGFRPFSRFPHCALVSEMAFTSKVHRHACLIGRFDDFRVTHGTARLHHRADTGVCQHLKAISEGEERV